jgi:ubiquinone/menaquinone biosynthesis C-methylase UbiE
MSGFTDNFSRQASLYARHRPHYPQVLYDFLLTQVTETTSAWDCATGNGQVATVLAKYFDQVHATDASAAQLAKADHSNHAKKQPIDYLVCTAENTHFPDHSFDLVTVAQALHWFNFEAFYQEVRRVSKPGGWLAVWGYGLMYTTNAPINLLIQDFYTNTIGPYWDQERRHIDASYQTIPFPFQEIPHPDFAMEVTWNLADCLGYLNTWSSVQKFIQTQGYNPVEIFGQALLPLWTEPQPVSFPIFMKIGKVV